MLAQQARQIAAEILSRHMLPEDMRGFGFAMPIFGSAEVLARFYPDRSPPLQRAINQAIEEEITRRGGTVRFVACSAVASEAWSSPEAMRAEADRHYCRINPPGTVITSEGCVLPRGFTPQIIPHARAE